MDNEEVVIRNTRKLFVEVTGGPDVSDAARQAKYKAPGNNHRM